MSANEFLKEEFFRRRSKNSSYSIRSFARDIGISHALVSQLFSGKRNLSSKLALKIATLLDLSKRDSKKLLDSTLFPASAITPHASAYQDPPVDQERLMASWFHLALLDLTYLKDFKSDPSWIAKKLGITSTEARDAIEQLKKLNLLEEKNNSLRKSQDMLRVRATRSQAATRAYYTNLLQKCAEELKNTSESAFQSRFIGGGTLAIESKKIPHAIKRLKELQDDFIQEFATKNADHVYQINLNFFSMTTHKKEP